MKVSGSNFFPAENSSGILHVARRASVRHSAGTTHTLAALRTECALRLGMSWLERRAAAALNPSTTCSVFPKSLAAYLRFNLHRRLM